LFLTGPCTVDVAEIQCEQKSYATDFTPTGRGASVPNSGGLYDVSNYGNHGTFVNTPTKGNDFGGSLILQWIKSVCFCNSYIKYHKNI